MPDKRILIVDITDDDEDRKLKELQVDFVWSLLGKKRIKSAKISIAKVDGNQFTIENSMAARE